MNITLLGGVKRKVKKLVTKSKRYLKKTKRYLTRERVIALSMLSRVIGMVLILSVIPLGTMKVNADYASKIEKPKIAEPKDEKPAMESKVVLDVQSNVPLKLSDSKVEIKVGESEYLKKEREAREAEAAKQTQLASADRDVVVREEYRPAPADPDLMAKRDLAKRAAAAYGIDWKILEAVWQVESGKSWDTAVSSYAGAQGPTQFMPGTWAAYAVDADGDGSANINDAEDAVYTGAKYLAAGGAASGNVDGALFNYNHAQWYVDMVKGVAASIVD